MLAVLLLAALPIYPGARPMSVRGNSGAQNRIFVVDAPKMKVATWYAQKFNKPIQRYGDQGVVYVAKRERRGSLPADPMIRVEQGAVLQSQPGGATMIILVDLEIPSGSVQNHNPGINLDPGKPKPAGKPTGGSDPNRYGHDPLGGRSVEGRSVEGSFR